MLGILISAGVTITEIPMVFIGLRPARALVRELDAVAERAFGNKKVEIGEKPGNIRQLRICRVCCCLVASSLSHHRRGTGGQRHGEQRHYSEYIQ